MQNQRNRASCRIGYPARCVRRLATSACTSRCYAFTSQGQMRPEIDRLHREVAWLRAEREIQKDHRVLRAGRGS